MYFVNVEFCAFLSFILCLFVLILFNLLICIKNSIKLKDKKTVRPEIRLNKNKTLAPQSFITHQSPCAQPMQRFKSQYKSKSGRSLHLPRLCPSYTAGSSGTERLLFTPYKTSDSGAISVTSGTVLRRSRTWSFTHRKFCSLLWCEQDFGP